MPTVIDSLIVQLGLDSKDVENKAPGVGRKLKEIEQGAASSEKATQGLSKEIKGAAGALASFLAVLGGTAAMKVFVNDAINANTQLRFLAQNLNMTVQSLFGLGAAGQMIGIGKNSMQSLAAQFRQIPGQLQAGQQPSIIRLLARAGVSWDQSPEQMMAGLAQWFQTMPAQVATGIGTSYGLTFDQMSFLLQGANKVAEQLKMGGMFSPSGRETREAAELKQQLTLLGLQWQKIGYDLLSLVTPALEKVIGLFRSMAQWAQGHEKVVAVLAGIVAAVSALVAITGAILAFGAAFAALGTVFAAIVSPLGLVIAGITALASGMGLLWNDYKVWAEKGNSLFDWSKFASVIHKAGDEFAYLRDKIVEAKDSIEAWWKKNAPTSLGGVSDDVKRRAEGIARAEGFYAKGKPNIPQRANNPGDISWGEFARQNGATGYVEAAGGHKIATFRDVGAGWSALYALLGENRFSGLTDAQAYGEYTRLSGSGLASYVANASTSHATDNSVTNHIGQITIQGTSLGTNVTPAMARGMDFTTLVAQAMGAVR